MCERSSKWITVKGLLQGMPLCLADGGGAYYRGEGVLTTPIPRAVIFMLEGGRM